MTTYPTQGHRFSYSSGPQDVAVDPHHPHLVGYVPTSSNSICRHCGQRAPIRLNGVNASCSVCGGPRTPFSSKALNWAGKPSRWGGTAAKVAGSLVLLFGLTFSLSLGLIINWLASLGLALGIALPFVVLTLLVGGGFLFGSRKLRKSGDESERLARLETVRALAAHRGGQLTAYEVARALQLPEQQADDMLTELAKDPDVDATLDLDERGEIQYLFGKSSIDRWRLQVPSRIDVTPAQQAAPYYEAQQEAEASAEAAASPARRQR